MNKRGLIVPFMKMTDTVMIFGSRTSAKMPSQVVSLTTQRKLTESSSSAKASKCCKGTIMTSYKKPIDLYLDYNKVGTH